MIRRLLGIVLCAGSAMLLLAAPPAHAAGNQTYSSRCAACHKPNGAGVPGQFPRLQGRTAQMASTKDGRAYLVKVMLFGSMGAITVDGRKMNGMMPPMGTMSDQDLADVLNYIVGLGGTGKPAKPFTANEVKSVRAAGRLTAAQVAKERAGLASRGVVP